jgi:hypothetical protein
VFLKRRKDIVSKLASAAAMVVPATVYCRGDARPFTPDEGDVCARAVITSYFSAKAEVNRRVNALLQYSRFRETYHGTEGNPSFWGSVRTAATAAAATVTAAADVKTATAASSGDIGRRDTP